MLLEQKEHGESSITSTVSRYTEIRRTVGIKETEEDDGMLVVLGILNAILVLSYLVTLFVMYRLLRVNHNEMWKDMGSPTLLWNNSLRAIAETLHFLFSRKAAELGDDSLLSAVRLARILLILILIVFAVLSIAEAR